MSFDMHPSFLDATGNENELVKTTGFSRLLAAVRRVITTLRSGSAKPNNRLASAGGRS